MAAMASKTQDPVEFYKPSSISELADDMDPFHEPQDPLEFSKPSSISELADDMDSFHEPLDPMESSKPSSISELADDMDPSHEPLDPMESSKPSSISVLANDMNPSHEPNQNENNRKLNVQEMISIWSLARLIRDLGNRYQCVSFAEELGLVPTERMCRRHRIPMRVAASRNRSFGSWACFKRTCIGKSIISRTNGTFFENVKIDLSHVFYLVYAFAHKWDYIMVSIQDPWKEETGKCLSSSTISDWYRHCRETIVAYQIDHLDNLGKIGGPGKVVQIDESKFSKKSHIEGSWILGMIEDGSEDLRLEVCPNNERSAEVLIPLIKKHVEVGSIIHTDNWSAYDCLEEHGFVHKKVSHTDPENPSIASDGINTQRIKSQWSAVKRYYRQDNYNKNYLENFTDSIVEYLWRRNIIRFKKDPFMQIIKAIKYVYKVK